MNAGLRRVERRTVEETEPVRTRPASRQERQPTGTLSFFL